MCNRVMKVVRGWIILKCFPQRTHFSASLYQINILIPRTSFAESKYYKLARVDPKTQDWLDILIWQHFPKKQSLFAKKICKLVVLFILSCNNQLTRDFLTVATKLSF